MGSHMGLCGWLSPNIHVVACVSALLVFRMLPCVHGPLQPVDGHRLFIPVGAFAVLYGGVQTHFLCSVLRRNC